MRRHFLIPVLLLLYGSVGAHAQQYSGTIFVGQGQTIVPFNPASTSPVTFSGLDPLGHDSLIVKWQTFDLAQHKYVPSIQRFDLQNVSEIAFGGAQDSVALIIRSNGTDN